MNASCGMIWSITIALRRKRELTTHCASRRCPNELEDRTKIAGYQGEHHCSHHKGSCEDEMKIWVERLPWEPVMLSHISCKNPRSTYKKKARTNQHGFPCYKAF